MKVQKDKYARSKWKPNCSVCQFSKKNKDFRTRLFSSSYFNPEATESPMDVVHDYKGIFGQSLLYACLKRHHSKDLIRPASKIINGELVIDNRMKPTFEVIERVGGATTNHELGLDDFIEKGRTMLANGELRITATTYLTAIKTKMDNDAKTKDRRVDLLSNLFKGAAPKKIDEES